MSKLFDEFDSDIEDIPESTPVFEFDDDEDQEFVPSFKRDKIFNNDYNTGNLDFEEFDLPKVDSFYADSNLEDCYDAFEYARKKHLEELVDRYFSESQYYTEFLSKKKIPKQIIPLVFESIRGRFVGIEYSGSEIFSTIAEYFGLNYELLYENIPSIYREQLVRELDDKYHMLKRRGVKRLF